MVRIEERGVGVGVRGWVDQNLDKFKRLKRNGFSFYFFFPHHPAL
jgi:hypothetical protein